MSLDGIKEFARVMSVMQESRVGLLSGDNQDIRLGQLLHEAKETVKTDFAKITLEQEPEKKRKRFCPEAYPYGLDWNNCGLEEFVACGDSTAKKYKKCRYWKRNKIGPYNSKRKNDE